MSPPTPTRELDLERKEELIMAKHLRAARVTILAKVGYPLVKVKYFFGV